MGQDNLKGFDMGKIKTKKDLKLYRKIDLMMNFGFTKFGIFKKNVNLYDEYLQ